MSKRSSTIDWFARIVAASGLLLALFSWYLTYHWHQQSVEDRIVLRLNATTRGANSLGTLDAEIVNIGMRPIYIEKVELLMKEGEGGQFFSEGNSGIEAGTSVTTLEPGQAGHFELPWDFTHTPLSLDNRLVTVNGEDEDASVCIQTTRASFRRPANISNVTTLVVKKPPPTVRPPQALIPPTITPPTITSITTASIDSTECP